MSLIDKLFKPNIKGKRVTSRILDSYNYQIQNAISQYRYALNDATNYNNRIKLYKLYEQSLRDSHLSGLISLRKEKILGTKFKLYDKNGVEYKTDILNSKWFYEFLSYALDKTYWGFSLLEIKGIKGSNITGIRQVPHKNVDIVNTEIIPDINKPNEKFSYASSKYSKWLLEIVDDEKNLGILSNVVPLIMWKKSTMSAWAEFTEIFGMPIRIGKTSSTIETDRQRLAEFLKGLAKSAYAVIDEAETIEFIETSKTDSFNVYDKFIELINKEISKIIIGATEITDSSKGSGYAQSSVHNMQFDAKINSDIREMEFVVNDLLLPKLAYFNLLPDGLTFKFDTFKELSLSEQINIDAALNSIYPVDKNYLEDKYRVKFNNDGKNNG